jgi:hypothetical protein
MAHAAVGDGAERYGVPHFVIRARLHKGLSEGTMKVGSMLDDERLKMNLPQCCAYCGSVGKLSLDHLIPRIAGGQDSGDNVVWACRSCNSSKGGRDLLVWMKSKDRFPPLMLLRRYLKLALAHSTVNGLLEVSLSEAADLPFAIDHIPTSYPKPVDLVLWVEPTAAE